MSDRWHKSKWVTECVEVSAMGKTAQKCGNERVMTLWGETSLRACSLDRVLWEPLREKSILDLSHAVCKTQQFKVPERGLVVICFDSSRSTFQLWKANLLFPETGEFWCGLQVQLDPGVQMIPPGFHHFFPLRWLHFQGLIVFATLSSRFAGCVVTEPLDHLALSLCCSGRGVDLDTGYWWLEPVWGLLNGTHWDGEMGISLKKVMVKMVGCWADRNHTVPNQPLS